MKKRILFKTNMAIAVIIVIGCLAMLGFNFKTFSEVVEDDIEHIARLTSSTIYAEIGNALTQPVFVSLTMANDTFLKSWLTAEKAGEEGHAQLLFNYLTTLKKKYHYNSVFLISAASNTYYHVDGVHKVVSPENAHDVWYYSFLKSGRAYKLNVDQDEADQNILTVFVDCRIESAEGKLLGVVGVGVKMSHLQALLASYERDFGLRAVLIDGQGVVQVDTDSTRIESANLFAKETLLPFKERILGNVSGAELFWYPEGATENCVISRYIDTMNWYLIVEKNTKVIRESLFSLLWQDSAIIVVIVALLVALISAIIVRYNGMMLRMATTDELTGLPNRRSFNERFQKGLMRRASGEEGQCVLFMFDIDDFKSINDRRGHLFGNAVLVKAAVTADAVLGPHSVLARWGGDEFAGMLWGPYAEGEALLQRLVEEMAGQRVEDESFSISVGATRIAPSRLGRESAFDEILKEADIALYQSKENGKNRLTLFTNISG